MKMVIYYLKDYIYITIKEKVKNIIKEKLNLKENIYMIKNIMERDLMKMEI